MRVMVMNLQYKGLERQLNIRVRRGRECKGWSVECGVQSVECHVWSVRCGV